MKLLMLLIGGLVAVPQVKPTACERIIFIRHIGIQDKSVDGLLFTTQKGLPDKIGHDWYTQVLLNDEEFSALERGMAKYRFATDTSLFALSYGTFSIVAQDSCKPEKQSWCNGRHSTEFFTFLLKEAEQFTPATRQYAKQQIAPYARQW